MWCRDIVLTRAQIRALERKMRERSHYGSLRAGEIKRKVRLQDIQTQGAVGARDVGTLSLRDLHILGLGLYWGEGYKRGNGELGFTNSDPRMILAFILWIQKVYKISRKDLILRVGINAAYKSQQDSAVTYWAKITQTTRSQFTKTSLIQTRLKSFDEDSAKKYFGTLRVKVRRATQLRRRIMGSIEHIAGSM